MDKASFDIPATHHHMATVNDNEFGVVDGVVKIGPWEYVLHDRHHHNNNTNNNHNGFEDSRLQEQLEYETWVKDPGTAGTKASTSSFSSSSKAEGQGETGSNASSSSPSSRLKVPQWLRRERQDAIAAHEVARFAVEPVRSVRHVAGGQDRGTVLDRDADHLAALARHFHLIADRGFQ